MAGDSSLREIPGNQERLPTDPPQPDVETLEDRIYLEEVLDLGPNRTDIYLRRDGPAVTVAGGAFGSGSPCLAELGRNMKTVLTFPVRESWVLRESSPIYQATATPPKTRVAVFGSFMGGCHVLQELLFGPLARRVTAVGVATDDPTQPFTHPEVRLWKYPHRREDELLVPRFAAEQHLSVFIGRVKTPEFFELFMDDWRPSLCLMATFGQKIPTALINYPSLGLYNFHHGGDTWPSYPGPDPIAAMVRDGRTHLALTIHKVTDVIDGGEFVARSHQVAIPAGINAIEMHRITWPQMGPFIRRSVGAMLTAAETRPTGPPLILQEAVVRYRTSDHGDWEEHLAA